MEKDTFFFFFLRNLRENITTTIIPTILLSQILEISLLFLEKKTAMGNCRANKKNIEAVALLTVTIFFDISNTAKIATITRDSHGPTFLFYIFLLCTHSSSVTLSYPSSTHSRGWADIVHACTSRTGVRQAHLIKVPIDLQQNWEKLEAVAADACEQLVCVLSVFWGFFFVLFFTCSPPNTARHAVIATRWTGEKIQGGRSRVTSRSETAWA